MNRIRTKWSDPDIRPWLDKHNAELIVYGSTLLFGGLVLFVSSL